MPYTVPVSFDTFFSNINLSGDHREIANRRRDDVVSTLKKNFKIIDAFPFGSIPKFTALKSRADVDVMLVLDWNAHIRGVSPDQLIKGVRDALSEWRTNVRKNGQAVTLYYKTWPNVDVVPVSQILNSDGSVSHYNVPDINAGAWIRSNPKTHAQSVEKKAGECGPNFRRIIKMIKHWNSTNGDYLQSYHIEVMALKVFSGDVSDTPWHVHKFFEDGRELLKTWLWHDGSFVDDYLNQSDRDEVCRRFDSAIRLSGRAWFLTYDKNSNHEEAIGLWRQIFGTEFPVYAS